MPLKLTRLEVHIGTQILPGELEKWCCNDGEVLDVVPEEIAEPHEGSDTLYVIRQSRPLDCLQLGLAWFDSFWS